MLVGGPLLALFLFVFTYLIERQGFLNAGVSRQSIRDQYFRTTFTLMGHLAKADGRISEPEIKMAEQQMSRMGISKAHRLEAIELFKQGAEQSFSLDDEMQRCKSVLGRSGNLYKMLLITLVTTAFADNELHASEREVLQQVAAHIGINEMHFEQILQMVAAQQGFGAHQRSSYSQSNAFKQKDLDPVTQAYAALGVPASVIDKDLKRAYRKLMSQHHPDKLIAQGMPDDMIEIATEKTQEIQSAYELLQKHRGIKH